MLQNIFNFSYLSFFNFVGFGGIVTSLILWRFPDLNKRFTLILMYFLFFLSINLAFSLNKTKFGFQYIETFGKNLGGLMAFGPTLGVDGVSVLMIALTCFIFPLCFLSIWDTKDDQMSQTCLLYFSLEVLTINVFLQLNILYFFIFFEAVLIPMVIIIGVYGSRERRIYAAYRFFFYTLFGSLIALTGIIILYAEYKSLNLLYLSKISIKREMQIVLWILFFFGFAVKIPMFLFHSWLPEAHTEAPTAGSVILAAIMLKLGGFGFFRVSLLLFPVGGAYWSPLIYLLSSLAVIYISLIAIVQVDLKRIIAYSSIAHMGFVTAGLFSFNHISLSGSIFVMISHGFVSSALFFSVGFLYDRHKTRSIFYYRGLSTVMPLFSSFFLFFMLANSAIPGTSSFVGEFLVITGVMSQNKFLAFLLCANAFLVVLYSLWIFNKICFGKVSTEFISSFVDLTPREFLILSILAFTIIIFGVYPNGILNLLQGIYPYSSMIGVSGEVYPGTIVDTLKSIIQK